MGAWKGTLLAFLIQPVNHRDDLRNDVNYGGVGEPAWSRYFADIDFCLIAKEVWREKSAAFHPQP